jgi:hypothetical protein
VAEGHPTISPHGSTGLTKLCSACKGIKPLESFHPKRKMRLGVSNVCKGCHQVYVESWKKKNAPKAKRMRRKYMLRRLYGITPEDYQAMLDSQGGLCAICKVAPSAKLLSVDHDHTTGAVRGLLCASCNRGLGYLNEEPGRLRAAAEYLELSR